MFYVRIPINNSDKRYQFVEGLGSFSCLAFVQSIIRNIGVVWTIEM